MDQCTSRLMGHFQEFGDVVPWHKRVQVQSAAELASIFGSIAERAPPHRTTLLDALPLSNRTAIRTTLDNPKIIPAKDLQLLNCSGMSKSTAFTPVSRQI